MCVDRKTREHSLAMWTQPPSKGEKRAQSLRMLTPEEPEVARAHGSMGTPLAGTEANKRSVTRTTSYNAHPVVDEISLLSRNVVSTLEFESP